MGCGKTGLEAVAIILARNDALQTRVDMEKGRLIQETKWVGEQMELLMKQIWVMKERVRMIQVDPWHQLESSCEMKLACHDQIRWIQKYFATLTFYNLGIHDSTLIYRLNETHIEYFFFCNCRCITSLDVVMEQTLSLSLH